MRNAVPLLGAGVDIEDIRRFEVKKKDIRFLNKIFSKKE